MYVLVYRRRFYAVDKRSYSRWLCLFTNGDSTQLTSGVIHDDCACFQTEILRCWQAELFTMIALVYRQGFYVVDKPSHSRWLRLFTDGDSTLLTSRVIHDDYACLQTEILRSWQAELFIMIALVYRRRFYAVDKPSYSRWLRLFADGDSTQLTSQVIQDDCACLQTGILRRWQAELFTMIALVYRWRFYVVDKPSCSRWLHLFTDEDSTQLTSRVIHDDCACLQTGILRSWQAELFTMMHFFTDRDST